MEFSAQQIAGFLNGTIEGDPNVKVSNFSKIEEGKPGTLTFLANLKYAHHIYNTEASIVLVNNDFKPEQPIRATLVKVENAYAALAMLLNLVEQSKSKKKGVDSTAFIAASATVSDDCYVGNFAYIGEGVKMGKNCMVYPHAYIGDHVTVGDNCVFYPHATVYENCTIGNNCILHAGSVVGADGFGFAPEGETYKKIPQLGNVIIEDDASFALRPGTGQPEEPAAAGCVQYQPQGGGQAAGGQLFQHHNALDAGSGALFQGELPEGEYRDPGRQL